MQIHLSRNGQPFGVHESETVKAGLRGGIFLPTDLAWHEGASGWLLLSQVPGFIESSPPPHAPNSYQPTPPPAYTPQAPLYPAPQAPMPGQYAASAGAGPRGLRRIPLWARITVGALVGAAVAVLASYLNYVREHNEREAEDARWLEEMRQADSNTPAPGGSSTQPTSASTRAPAASNNSSALPAFTLMQAYQRDAATAAARYKGKNLTLTGKVVYAGTNPMNMTSVLLAGDESESHNVSCSFPASARAAVEGLRKGQTVTIRGTGDRYQYGDLAVENCELVR